ncbi:hypothetical protein [Stygiolobus caldivivus]|uniref:Uncharacterized protein n=1 Tax=Stygiolobus caldivivus TaxID=2824673 RepID=A0A8D5U5R1_9CREN|nr:hypothetical protein [Stygiolobus caldivivus]BCU69762.1 hypothetical protein KN1_10590 [Stygiolobus caldivivus]
MQESLVNLLEKYLGKGREEVTREIGEYFRGEVEKINALVRGRGVNEGLIGDLLVLFRGKYERLINVNRVVKLIAERCCDEIVNELKEGRCANFIQVVSGIRSKAWVEGTKEVVSRALTVNENYVTEINNTLKSIYDLASGWVHGKTESKDVIIQNLNTIIDDLYFLLYIEFKLSSGTM